MQKLDINTPKAIFTVILINGERIKHTYDIPLDVNEVNKLVDEINNMIGNSMESDKKRVLWFDNPLVLYNIDNVSGIYIDTLESKELHEMIKKSQEKLGFIKNNKFAKGGH